MNENDLAKRIKQHLDFGADHLDSRVQYRLQAARQHALQAHARPHHSLNFAWGHGGSHHHGHHGSHLPFRTWLPLAVLILGLLFITYWHTTEPANDISEIDAHLLAEDLPFDAFIDPGFDTWLEGSFEK